MKKSVLVFCLWSCGGSSEFASLFDGHDAMVGPDAADDGGPPSDDAATVDDGSDAATVGDHSVGSSGSSSGGSSGSSGGSGGSGGSGASGTGGAAGSSGGACDGGPYVTHDNGLGQTWQDCTPLGTATQAQATAACKASCTVNCYVTEIKICSDAGEMGVACAPILTVWSWSPSRAVIQRGMGDAALTCTVLATWQ